ncbi:MAG: alpha/beta hydrolase [Gemmatimonadales bacterium]
MRYMLLALVTLLAPSTLVAQGRFPLTIGTQDSIRSETLKEMRRYLVYTPPSYSDTTFAPQRYPVLYLLDGDAHFHSVTGLAQILGTGVNGTYAIPEMIVVAIPNTNRTRDMTPTHVTVGLDGKPSPAFRTTGGMGNFLSFIKNELIPQIDSRYRTTPYRIFVGHSLGGITTINALFTIPETFNAYVAIDPSLWWDNATMLKTTKDRLVNGDYRNKVLFLGQANTINPDDSTANPHFNAMVRFNSLTKAYNKSGLRFGYKYYDNDDHGSVPLITTYDALRFIFDGYRLDLGRLLGNPSLLTAHYETLSAKLGAPFMPSEAIVSQLGQIALSQDTTKGIAFFEIGTRLYPNSYRSHDRLGAVWAAKGDKAKAAGYYRRSLELNPGNTKSAEALKGLER